MVWFVLGSCTLKIYPTVRRVVVERYNLHEPFALMSLEGAHDDRNGVIFSSLP